MKRILLAAFLWAAFSFSALAQTSQVAVLQPLTPAHRLSIDGTSRVITSSLMAYTEIVRLVCSVSCYVQFGVSGTTPVAFAGGTTSSIFLPANVPEYFKAPANGKIAVIRSSGDGTLSVQEFGR